MVTEDALRALLADAVRDICKRHKEDLEEAVGALRKDVARLEGALNPTQAAGDQGCGFGAGVGARSTPAQNLGEDRSPTQNPTLDDSDPRGGDAPGKAMGQQRPQASSKCQDMAIGYVPLRAGSRLQDEAMGRQPSLASRYDRSTHGYSAAHIMELLSGGAPASSSPGKAQTKPASVLFVFVMISVAVSTLSLGVSFDYYPESKVWVAVETACVLVFAVEFVVKLTFLEKWAYFFGPKYESSALFRSVRSLDNKSLTDWKQLHTKDKEVWINSFWNWFDFLVTAVAVVDLAVTLSGIDGGSGSIAVLRCARLFRALRVVKLLRIPLVKDMMDIFIGLILGTPLLAGAFVLLLWTVYLAAIAFRLIFGPTIEAGERCDSFKGCMNETQFSASCPELPRHEYYTYKYFGTVPKAMFTLFRCTTIDCSSEEGTSLIPLFSRVYGMRFDLYWSILTIWIVCGILNIIQASFVGKTSSQIEARESSYIQHQLSRLARAVVDWAISQDLVHSVGTSGIGELIQSPAGQSQWPRRGEVSFDLCQFEDMMGGSSDHSQIANGIIRDLGMDISAKDLFYILDMDESGNVDAVEVLDSLMMMSGIRQTGTLSTLIALHGLSSKMNDITGGGMSRLRVSDRSRNEAMRHSGSDTAGGEELSGQSF